MRIFPLCLDLSFTASRLKRKFIAVYVAPFDFFTFTQFFPFACAHFSVSLLQLVNCFARHCHIGWMCNGCVRVVYRVRHTRLAFLLKLTWNAHRSYIPNEFTPNVKRQSFLFFPTCNWHFNSYSCLFICLRGSML